MSRPATLRETAGDVARWARRPFFSPVQLLGLALLLQSWEPLWLVGFLLIVLGPELLGHRRRIATTTSLGALRLRRLRAWQRAWRWLAVAVGVALAMAVVAATDGVTYWLPWLVLVAVPAVLATFAVLEVRDIDQALRATWVHEGPRRWVRQDVTEDVA